jgi:FkbH-like protein
MKLREAIRLKRAAAARAGRRYTAFLAMGAMPLHLETLFGASLAVAMPNRAIACRTGPYGDLLEAVGAAEAADAHGVAVVLEYRDLDPRLGYRRVGGWTRASVANLLNEAELRLEGLRRRLSRITASRIALVMPNLPVPPLFGPPRGQSDEAELRLRRLVAGFAETASQQPNVTVVSQTELDRLSPLAVRHDLRSEILADFPYTIEHAGHLADLIARALAPAAPLKGLITDLDDTLWHGLVGEVGCENVSWTLDQGSHGHALYQQLLECLSELGVLLAIASKNDPDVVDEVLARPDLRPHRDCFFPIEAGWHAKSEGVGRILKRWNIAADAAAFIDDSPLELAEVKAQYPELHCYLYPKDEAGLLGLIGELRDLFGKSTLTEEDRLRAVSIRNAAKQEEALAEAGADVDAFLGSLDAELRLNFAKIPFDPRALDLINKTNQFNLNGRRVDESEWRSYLAQKESFLLVASYQDKFGPFGKIGVVFGRCAGQKLVIDGWVLSCRAFFRRVEHAMLDALFEHFCVDRIGLAFIPTKRNGPLQSFLSEMGAEPAAAPDSISRAVFLASCPPLPHRRLAEG